MLRCSCLAKDARGTLGHCRPWCDPLSPPQSTCYSMWSRFPVSPLELHSSDCCPHDSPGMLWLLPTKLRPQRSPSTTQPHISTPKLCSEVLPGHSSLYQFRFCCFKKKKNTNDSLKSTETASGKYFHGQMSGLSCYRNYPQDPEHWTRSPIPVQTCNKDDAAAVTP